jgi:predicted RNase H-like HicB family nuclease
MIQITYPALVRKDRKSDFGVEFPDFPGCVSGGTTYDDATRQAALALQFHVDGMIEDGEELPEPSTMDQVVANAGAKGAIPFFVVAKIKQKSRAVRFTATMDEALLQAIDEAVDAGAAPSRSGFLAEAARRRLRKKAS